MNKKKIKQKSQLKELWAFFFNDLNTTSTAFDEFAGSLGSVVEKLSRNLDARNTTRQKVFSFFLF